MTYRSLSIFAAALLSSVVFAGDEDKMSGAAAATFKAMDANRDERLTQNEVSGDVELAQRFAALDRDADGYLTKREYSAHGSQEKKPREGRQY